MDISIAILCGGKSRRFGKDKSLFRIDGKPLYQHVYDALSHLTDDIFVQCGSKDARLYGVKRNNDDYLDLGPISGIYSALKHGKHQRVAMVACDMPNMSAALIAHLIKYDADIVVPIWGSTGHMEPLCAIYNKRIVPLLEYHILSNDLRISSLYDACDVKKVEIEPLIEQGLIDKSVFKNINYLDDV
jgi:molybdopterin-guanine dinucleotide biosynthesis protein A